jgi:hypothetical protein
MKKRYLSHSVVDPDPESGAFLTPESGIRTRIIFYKQIFGLKYLNSLMRIRDQGWKKFGFGILDGKNSDPG